MSLTASGKKLHLSPVVLALMLLSFLPEGRSFAGWAIILHNTGFSASAPAGVSVPIGGEAAASYIWADLTTLCSTFLSAAEQFPYQVVMEKVSVLSTTHW